MPIATKEELQAMIRERGQMPISLPGWAERSVWGVQDGYLYATLWRDGALGPAIEIEAGSPKLTNPQDLAALLDLKTGMPWTIIYWAMREDYAALVAEHVGPSRPARPDTGMTVTLTEGFDLEAMFNHS
jgi:hypothetical protein